MENMTIEKVCRAVDGVFHGDASLLQEEIKGVVIDSRLAAKGDLFVALPGERVDGHDYIPQVLEKGALTALSEKEIPDAGSYILVADTRKAMQDLAAYYLRSLGTRVIGITGSAGKTSTKEAITSLLCQKYKVLKTEKNYNGQLGLPLTVFRLDSSYDVAVLEMGISLWGEMPRIAAIARPDIMVITNIGSCHLEAFQDRDGVFRAKTEVFDYMPERGIAVLNGDDDKLRAVEQVCGKKPLFTGVECREGIYADSICEHGLKGTSCVIHGQKDTYEVKIPLPGRHQVYNALDAVAVAEIMGLDHDEICRGISMMSALSGRGTLLETERFLIIDDCYNANPASMKAALSNLTLAEGRKVAILGSMFELGEHEKELHYEVGEYAAHCGLDAILCVGELAEEIARGACENGEKHALVRTFRTKNELLVYLPECLKAGDTILIKASNGMKFTEIVKMLSD